jgi:KDO2-lipid IV(A) lauroyltransferase
VADHRAKKLLFSAESVAYMAAASVLARLPPAVSYWVACRRGDLLFRYQAEQRAELSRNLLLVFGDGLSPAASQQVAREYFRRTSCEVVDMKLLRHNARPMRRLVQVRGREHLEAALAAGKGAVLCTGHFGNFQGGFSVLHASGFPVTTIGRMWYNYVPGISSIKRLFLDLYYRPVRRLRSRPNIEPWPGRPTVAVLAAAALRDNDVISIAIEPPPMGSDRARAIEVPFLGRTVRLLPGAVTLAQVTGAPLLMAFLHRAADYRHQVLEISAPVPLGGGTATVFERCVAELDAAVRRNPGHWGFFAQTEDLVGIGLLPPPPDRAGEDDQIETAPVRQGLFEVKGG